MTPHRRLTLSVASLLLAACVVATVMIAWRERHLELDSQWFRTTGGEGPLIEQQALWLVPGRLLEVTGLAERATPPYRARLRCEMSHFDEFEIGVMGPGGEVSLVLDRDHYPNRFDLGQMFSFEVVVGREQVAFVLDGTVNKQTLRPAGSIDRLFVAARRSQFRLVSIELAAGEDGRGTTFVRGPLRIRPGFMAYGIDLAVVAVLALAILCLLEIGLARLLRVDYARVWASWLRVTLPLAVVVLLAAVHQWLGSYAAPAPVIWLFFRLRFWLLVGGAFATKRTGWWRLLCAVAGLAALGAVYFVAFYHGTSWGLIRSVIVSISAVALVAGAMWVFSRGLGVTWPEGMAIAGPAFLPLIALAVICISGGDRAGLVLLLPVSVLVLTYPVSAHRTELRHYGWIMLILVVLAVGGIELGLRFHEDVARFRPYNIGRTYDPDRDLFWVPKGLFSDSGNWLQREDLHVRRIAFRGHEDEPVAKWPGEYRIMVLGGSNVWGDGQDRNDTTFCGLLETSLRAGGQNVRVLNAGVKGYNAFQVMVLLTKYCLAYQPDIVVLYLMRNDEAQDRGLFTYRELWTRSQQPSYRLLKNVQDQLHRSMLYNGLSRLVVNFRQRTAGQWYNERLWKPVNPAADFRQNLLDSIDAARHAGARVVLATEFWGEPFLASDGVDNQRLKELRAAMAEAARERNVPLLDAWSYFAATADPLRWVLREDPVHFNAAGHAEMARLLEEFLRQNKMLP